MLLSRATRLQTTTCRRFSSTALSTTSVLVLSDGTIESFRNNAFNPALPALLPLKSFSDLPAIGKWFLNSPDGRIVLNESYLNQYGSTIVPLEITKGILFSRSQQSLSFFLDASKYKAPTTRIYLAQAPIADLPQDLQDDVPTPEIVLKTGKGDVYDSSIWLGEAPTYTPLHRDPNPNLFVQLVGRKVVRLFKPEVGRSIFARVQEKINGAASETMRGEEMMAGAEKEALEAEVWGGEADGVGIDRGWQAELGAGDGLFIPKGWWHSVKSVGEGMTGSVNWWFR